jgi:excinuclease ABC subunit C
MAQAAAALHFEQAAHLRDEMEMLESLSLRGELDKHEQPEVFYMDPKKGVASLQQELRLSIPPRTIEGVDIAHLSGVETVASLVQFIDGMPFKSGYRRYRIREVEGVDDYASIYEVVSRRFSRANKGVKSLLPERPEGCFAQKTPDPFICPDLLLVDGGKGQLKRALQAFAALRIKPPTVLSLAKREELVYVMQGDGDAVRPEPLKLSRRCYALRLLQYVRDEAHRFAQHYHHLLRSKKTLE